MFPIFYCELPEKSSLLHELTLEAAHFLRAIPVVRTYFGSENCLGAFRSSMAKASSKPDKQKTKDGKRGKPSKEKNRKDKKKLAKKDKKPREESSSCPSSSSDSSDSDAEREEQKSKRQMESLAMAFGLSFA